MKKDLIKKALIVVALASSVNVMATPSPSEGTFKYIPMNKNDIVNQGNTKYSGSNCVPSSLANLLKINGYTLTDSVDDMKVKMRKGNLNEGCYYSEMETYLNENNIKFTKTSLNINDSNKAKEQLYSILDKQPILCAIDLNVNPYYDIDKPIYHSVCVVGYFKSNDKDDYLFILDSSNGGQIEMTSFTNFYKGYLQFESGYPIYMLEAKKELKYNTRVIAHSIDTIQYDLRDEEITLYE